MAITPINGDLFSEDQIQIKLPSLLVKSYIHLHQWQIYSMLLL